jgi:PAT family beta-lactamase induction signal transducer AmpG
VLAESIGWPPFFVLSAVLALPALVLLWGLRGAVRSLDAEAEAASS